MYVPTLLAMDLDQYKRTFVWITYRYSCEEEKGGLNGSVCFWHLSETLEFCCFEEWYIKRKETYKASAKYCKRIERKTEPEVLSKGEAERSQMKKQNQAQKT